MANEHISGKAAQTGTRLASGEDLEHLVRPEEGLISRRIFADPEVYERELERIFGRAWFFIGHESEIPERGDIVARQCGVDPVILVRDQAGVVRAFLNSCRHRGMRLCRTDRDNATTLRWSANPEPDLAGYEVLWRETTAPDWTNSRFVGDVTTYTIDLSKDNVFFGVRSVDKAGHRSPAAAPRPGS